MPKFQYMARRDLGAVITRVRIAEDMKKKQVLKYLIELARDNMDHRSIEFDGEKDVNCTLEITGDEYATYIEYRNRYGLAAKNKFFSDALKRGATYYVDNNPSPPPTGGKRKS